VCCEKSLTLHHLRFFFYTATDKILETYLYNAPICFLQNSDGKINCRKLKEIVKPEYYTYKHFKSFTIYLRAMAIHKRRPQSEGGGLSSADILRTRRVFQMRMSALFGAKSFGFFEIYSVSARTRGELSQCRHFVDKGCKFFAILCGHPLWTAPYNINILYLR